MVISIASIVSLVVTLLVLGVIVWLVNYIVAKVPIAEPFGNILRVVVLVVCCLIAIVVLLQFIGLLSNSALVLRP